MYKAISDLCRVEYGAGPNKVRSDDNTGIEIYGTGGKVGFSKEALFNEPLIVVARKGTLDNPILVDKPCWVIDTAYAAIPYCDVDVRWLYYQLLLFDLKRLNESTGVPSISRDYLKKQKIIYQEFDVQRKIADILRTIDDVIENTEAAIDKYQAIKAGMMQDLFTRGIDSKSGKLRPTIDEAPELYKETELGWIPKEWEIATLNEACGMKSGEGITSKSIDEYGRYPVYGGNGLRGYTSNYTHEGSYVLIGRQGALCGNVNRVDGKFFASEHAVVVSVNSDIDVDWLSHILDSMNLNTYSEASAQPGLAVGKILRLRIRIPQLYEQRIIASVIQSLNKKVEAETALHSEYNKIKQGLMADLLTGTVKTV